MDYWAGTFGLVVFALIETVLFMWVFGADKAWKEMNEGGDFKIPRIFYYIMKYITPAVLFIMMLWWFINDAIPILMLKNAAEADVPFIWASRALMVLLFVGILFLVRKAWMGHSENRRNSKLIIRLNHGTSNKRNYISGIGLERYYHINYILFL